MLVKSGPLAYLPVERIQFEPGSLEVKIYLSDHCYVLAQGHAAAELRARLEREALDPSKLWASVQAA